MVDYLDTLGKDAYTTLETPYGIGAAGISAALPALVDPYASTGRNFGVTLGAGLLAGLLSGMGRSSAQSQNQALMFQGEKMSTLPVLQQRAMVKEEPRLAGIYSALRAAEAKREENLFNLKQSKGVELEFAPQIAEAMLPAEQKKLLMGKNIDLIMNPQIAAATELGTIPAKRAALTSQNLTNRADEQGLVENQYYNPKDPTSKRWLSVEDPMVGLQTPVDFEIEKESKLADAKRIQAIKNLGYDKEKAEAIDTLAKEFKTTTEVKNYKQVERFGRQLMMAAKDINSASDLELVRLPLMMMEPIGTVMGGEQEAVMRSPSIPEQWKSLILNSLGGGPKLGGDIRQGLVDMALRIAKESKVQYMNELTRVSKIAKERNLPLDLIVGDFRPIETEDLANYGQEKTPKVQIVNDASGNQYQWDPAANKLKRIVK